MKKLSELEELKRAVEDIPPEFLAGLKQRGKKWNLPDDPRLEPHLYLATKISSQELYLDKQAFNAS